MPSKPFLQIRPGLLLLIFALPAPVQAAQKPCTPEELARGVASYTAFKRGSYFATFEDPLNNPLFRSCADGLPDHAVAMATKLGEKASRLSLFRSHFYPLVCCKNNRNETALHQAVLAGSPEMIEAVVRLAALVDKHRALFYAEQAKKGASAVADWQGGWCKRATQGLLGIYHAVSWGYDAWQHPPALSVLAGKNDAGATPLWLACYQRMHNSDLPNQVLNRIILLLLPGQPQGLPARPLLPAKFLPAWAREEEENRDKTAALLSAASYPGIPYDMDQCADSEEAYPFELFLEEGGDGLCTDEELYDFLAHGLKPACQHGRRSPWHGLLEKRYYKSAWYLLARLGRAHGGPVSSMEDCLFSTLFAADKGEEPVLEKACSLLVDREKESRSKFLFDFILLFFEKPMRHARHIYSELYRQVAIQVWDHLLCFPCGKGKEPSLLIYQVGGLLLQWLNWESMVDLLNRKGCSLPAESFLGAYAWYKQVALLATQARPEEAAQVEMLEKKGRLLARRCQTACRQSPSFRQFLAGQLAAWETRRPEAARPAAAAFATLALHGM